MAEATPQETAPSAPDVPLDEAEMILGVEEQSPGGEQTATSGADAASKPEEPAEADAKPSTQEGAHEKTNTVRPLLQRNGSTPNQFPPLPPVPAQIPAPVLASASTPVPPGPGNPTDSLSLVQLRSLVRDMPRAAEQTSYAFEYKDASSLYEEIEEWFSYNPEDRGMLFDAEAAFAREWTFYSGLDQDGGSAYENGRIDWTKADAAERERFVQHTLEALGQAESESRSRSLGALVYLLLGCWHETAGLELPGQTSTADAGEAMQEQDAPLTSPEKSAVQIDWMKRNVQLICDAGGYQPIYAILRKCCLREWCVCSLYV